MVDQALNLYLKGYTYEEIYDQIGVERSQYKPLITNRVKAVHDNAYKVRRKWKDFSYRWNDARNTVINSGCDLSSILIVPKEGNEENS